MKTKHYIVSGRIPYDDEDSTYHFELPEGASAEEAFVLRIYSDGDPDELPEDWRERDQPCGVPWAIINAVIEIPGPPISFYCN
jgi:hypothetical protein